MNILVLDDEKEIADLVEVYLKNENYNVFKFYDSKEAIKNRTRKVNNQRKFKSEQLKDLFSSSEVVYKRFSKEQCSEIDVQIISAYDLLTDSDYWEAEHDFNEFENHQMQ